MNRESEGCPRPSLPESTERHTGLLNERELKSLAWAVRRAARFGDGYGQNIRSAERALAKIRGAAAGEQPT